MHQERLWFSRNRGVLQEIEIRPDRSALRAHRVRVDVVDETSSIGHMVYNNTEYYVLEHCAHVPSDRSHLFISPVAWLREGFYLRGASKTLS